MLTINDIKTAHRRISPHVHKTPIATSNLLNEWLGHEVYFKMECYQKTGSFKIRGATNFIQTLIESQLSVSRIVANSSGNHAQAVSFAGNQAGIPVAIYASDNISAVKAAATKFYGADLHLFRNRPLADEAVEEASKQDDVVWIPPYNHPDIVCGQGTACLEALDEVNDIDAVFTPCGGGGLTSGSLIVTRSLLPKAKMFAVEPLVANDAAESRRQNTIVKLKQAPNTIADGVATPSVGDVTFPYIRQLNDLYEVSETCIKYWTQWLQHLLKAHIEPSCAMVMQGVAEYLASCKTKQRVMVIISGGNISTQTSQKIWSNDYLSIRPHCHIKDEL